MTIALGAGCWSRYRAVVESQTTEPKAGTAGRRAVIGPQSVFRAPVQVLYSKIFTVAFCVFAITVLPVPIALGQTWQHGPGFRFTALVVPADGKTGFTLLPPQQTSVWFTNNLPESRSLTNTLLP